MVSSLFQVLSGTCELREKLVKDGVERMERIGVRQTGGIFFIDSFFYSMSCAYFRLEHLMFLEKRHFWIPTQGQLQQ